MAENLLPLTAYLVTVIVLNIAASGFFFALKRHSHPGYSVFPNHFHLYFLIIAGSYVAASILPIFSQPLSTLVGNSLIIAAYYVLLGGLLSRKGQIDKVRSVLIWALCNVVAYLLLEFLARWVLNWNSNGLLSRVFTLLNLIVLVVVSLRHVRRGPAPGLIGERVMRTSLILHAVLAVVTLMLAVAFVDIFVYMTFVFGILLLNTLLMSGSLLMMLLSDQVELNYSLSIEDPLTRLHNRRFFYQRLNEEIDHHRRHGLPLTVILADIDHFKRINDRLGHQRGDELLCEFSLLLSREKRSSDVIARFGGEEFIVLLPDTSESDASHWAERVLQRTRSIAIETGQSLTVSLGVATVLNAEHESVEALLKRADQALYQAKGKGRDRYSVAAPNIGVRATS